MAQHGKANAQVFGVSVDTFFTLKAFQDQQKLNFPLLSDFNKTVIRDYGVFNEDMIGLKGIAKRAVFVIDKAYNHWIDGTQLAIIDAVAIFVGQRVDRERTASPQ